MSEPLFQCPYCGNAKTSWSGEASTVSCCKEVGHCAPLDPVTEAYLQSINAFCDVLFGPVNK